MVEHVRTIQECPFATVQLLMGEIIVRSVKVAHLNIILTNKVFPNITPNERNTIELIYFINVNRLHML